MKYRNFEGRTYSDVKYVYLFLRPDGNFYTVSEYCMKIEYVYYNMRRWKSYEV